MAISDTAINPKPITVEIPFKASDISKYCDNSCEKAITNKPTINSSKAFFLLGFITFYFI